MAPYKIGILNVGSEGEQFIQRELYNHFPPSRILRNIYLKKENNDYTEIDILTIEYCGIFVFEAKNFSGAIFGSQEDTSWTQVQKNTKRQFYNPIAQNNTHIKALKNNLRQYPHIQFYNFVVFSGTAHLNIKPVTLQNTYVIPLNLLGKTIEDIKRATDTGNDNIPSTQRKEIADILSNSSRPSKIIRDQHLNKVKENLLKCPFCGGELVERQNKNNGNKFIGCKNFPKCRYTRK